MKKNNTENDKNYEREQIAVFVITKNEEKKIARCLEHLKWTDELVVLDSGSTDRTQEISKRFTDKVYEKKFEGYGFQKQAAINLCSKQWILEVDADEVVPEDAAEEIKELLKNKDKLNNYSAYMIRRQEYFLGKPLMISKIIRLYKNGNVKYNDIIHEKVDVIGPIGMLKKIIIHESDKYDTIASRIDKNNSYTKIEAELLYKQRINRNRLTNMLITVAEMVIVPTTYFFWMYIFRGLIFKGYRGLIWSLITMHYHFLIYAKLYELYSTVFIKQKKYLYSENI